MRMNHLVVALGAALALGCGIAQAQTADDYNGLFDGSGAVDHAVKEVATVQEVPFQLVELDGNIIEAVGGEDFIFQDATGTLLVHVPEEVMVGEEITPSTLVRIQGEVHQDAALPVSVDVYQLDTK